MRLHLVIYIALTYILYDINSSIVQLCSYIQFIQSGFCVVTPPSDDLQHQRGNIQCYVLTVIRICQNKILTVVDVDSPDHTASHDEVT